MNERVMQFRIGMFVIVAGLVLTMLIVWFGESPALFRDMVYVRVHYLEAPGVGEGIPVRKSGIRVGEVSAVAFDDRAGQPDGVIVTLALERRYHIKAGSTPRISRALIGDVSIDMLPGAGPGTMQVGTDPHTAPIIEGAVAPDPANALVAATATLDSINKAASGIASVTKKAEGIDELLTTWKSTGEKLGSASSSIDKLVKDNEANFQPAVDNLRTFLQKANDTLDPATQEKMRAGIDHFNTASAKLDTGLASIQPLLKDLGAPVSETPTTNFGWSMMRFNRVMFDVSVLTREFTNGKGGLNTNGSLQRMLTRPEMFDNMNKMASNVSDFFAGGKLVLRNLNTFAEKVAKDPGMLTRGALRP